MNKNHSVLALLVFGSSLSLMGPAHANVCPATPNTADCNLFVTFGPGGSITTTGPGGNYDGIEDALIGVINNSGHTLTSFSISNPNIFGFDGDGIDTYSGASNVIDTSGYGGPLGYFTNIDPTQSTGVVNFLGGLANGSTTYFSLEEAINPNQPPVIGAPEPGTVALLGMGLGLLWLSRRRREAA